MTMNVITVDNSRAGNPFSIQLAPLVPLNANSADGVGTAGRVFNGHEEVDKGPHRQYGIYSIHVHPLISSPLPHNNNADVPAPDPSPPSDLASPSCSSNSNDCHAYHSPHDQSLPYNPSE